MGNSSQRSVQKKYNKCIKNFLKKQKENLKKFDQTEVKRFATKYFQIFLNKMKYNLFNSFRFESCITLYIEGKACWLSLFGNALQKYINRVHEPAKMTPFELSTNQKPKPNHI